MADLEIEDFDEEAQDQERRRRRGKNPEDEPVENLGEVPLFPDAKLNVSKTISHIRVTRLTPPGEGFKGKIPPDMDENYIGTRWGNGFYKLQACNSKNRILRQHDIPISTEDEEAPAKSNGGGGSPDGFALSSLKAQHMAHEAERKRSQELAERVNDQVTKQGEMYTRTLTSQYEKQVDRDRQHYQIESGHQADFCKSMLAQAAQQHSMAMEQARTSHEQSMERMAAMNAAQAQQNNPLTMISVLMRGLNMGRDMSDGNDQSEWIQGLAQGKDMLGHLATMASAQGGKTLPGAAPVPKLPGPSPLVPPAPTSAAPPSRPRFEPDQLQRITRLKALCDSKGIDFSAMLAEAESLVEGSTDADLVDNDDDDDEGQPTPPNAAGTRNPASLLDGAQPPGTPGAEDGAVGLDTAVDGAS